MIGLRWLIALLLCCATIINYLDRQLLSVIAPILRRDLHISNTQYAYALNSFLVAYAVMFTVGGWLIDRLKTRLGLALSLGVWSFASLCHVLIRNIWDLAICRLLLGISEPGNFTAAVKAISAWFPSKERGVAIGFVIGGTGLGAVIAPPLTLWLAIHFGWRVAFLVPSLSGLFLLPVWLYVYREPSHHPWLSSEEYNYILQDRNLLQESAAPRLRWAQLLGLRQSWSFILARSFADPLGYFYWFWIPSFLVSAKGFSYATLMKWLWIPYVAQGIGQLAGGYFSGYLIERKLPVLLSRKLGLSVAAILSPVALLSLRASHTASILVPISVATFGIGWWGANYNSAMMDAIPENSVSSVAGMAGTVGAISSMLGTWLTGYAADHGAYTFVLFVNCSLIFLSIAASWLLLQKPVGADV